MRRYSFIFASCLIVSNVGYMGTPPMVDWFLSGGIENARPRQNLCFCQGRAYIFHPRCHLDLRYDPYTLRNTFIFPATDVCPTSQDTKLVLIAFHCALSGPFGRLHFHPALTYPDSLCAHDCFDFRFIGLVC